MANKLGTVQSEALLSRLEERFKQNMHRHSAHGWESVSAKLVLNPDKLWSLHLMDQTGGEPDVIGFETDTSELYFVDCSVESPAGRRSYCYDRAGLESRKESKPENTAIDMAAQMGIEILNEIQYRALQQTGRFDTKTSSWLKTPADIRKLGGALFAEFRYDHVFVFHNGAHSYYAARGFRGILRV